jgi:hypothetical protein
MVAACPKKFFPTNVNYFPKVPFLKNALGQAGPFLGGPPGLEGNFFRGGFGAHRHRGMVPFQNPPLARLHLERGTFGKDFSETDFF